MLEAPVQVSNILIYGCTTTDKEMNLAVSGCSKLQSSPCLFTVSSPFSTVTRCVKLSDAGHAHATRRGINIRVTDSFHYSSFFPNTSYSIQSHPPLILTLTVSPTLTTVTHLIHVIGIFMASTRHTPSSKYIYLIGTRQRQRQIRDLYLVCLRRLLGVFLSGLLVKSPT